MRPNRIPNQQQQGFTLIEVLASLIVVAVAMAALFPVLSVIAYRRTMAQRIETAQSLARSEVNRIRTLVDIELFGQGNLSNLVTDDNPLGQTANEKQEALKSQLPNSNVNLNPGQNPNNVLPPTEIPDSPGVQNDTSVRTVTVQAAGGRGASTYVVQSFRSDGFLCINPITGRVIEGIPCSFQLGVRVYHQLSFDQAGFALDNPPLETTAVSGTRDLSNASTWRFPLATAQVEVNAAADLAGICRSVSLAAADCAGFPTPRP